MSRLEGSLQNWTVHDASFSAILTQMGQLLSRPSILREPPEARRHFDLRSDISQLRLPHHEETADGEIYSRTRQDAARETDASHHTFSEVSEIHYKVHFSVLIF